MATEIKTKAGFDAEVLSSDKPVLVDFYATWCSPCKMLAPVIDEIASEKSGIKVVKINVDEQPQLAQAYSVMSIPTLILIKNGEVAGRSTGFKRKNDIIAQFGL